MDFHIKVKPSQYTGDHLCKKPAPLSMLRINYLVETTGIPFGSWKEQNFDPIDNKWKFFKYEEVSASPDLMKVFERSHAVTFEFSPSSFKGIYMHWNLRKKELHYECKEKEFWEFVISSLVEAYDKDKTDSESVTCS